MFSIFKALLLLSVALSASALAAPQVHAVRAIDHDHHRFLARRMYAVAPVLEEVAAPVLVPRVTRKARMIKRCNAAKSKSSAAAATPTVVNVAPAPEDTASTTSTSTSTSTTPTPTSTRAAVPQATPDSTGTTTGPAPPAGTQSYLTGTQSGDGTFYGTGLGACGITNKDTDFIVAVSLDLFDTYPGHTANPNLNPVCNKQIKANYGGKSVTVTVTDRCTGCSVTSLDFSPAAFDKLADESIGRLHNVTWNWV